MGIGSIQAWVAMVEYFGFGGDFLENEAWTAFCFGGSANGGLTSGFFYSNFFYSTFVGKNLGFIFSTGFGFRNGFSFLLTVLAESFPKVFSVSVLESSICD